MTESTVTGLWILLGMVVLVFLVAGYAMAARKSSGHDEELGDLEHFDHEPGDPSTR